MVEAWHAAAAAAVHLPPSHVIIATDAAADNGDSASTAAAAAAAAGVRVMLMPDDDDGSHAGGYGTNAPWKKAQSRFPHALAAALAHMPPHVRWIVSQDTDTALNWDALAPVLASHRYDHKVIFGCV